MVNKYHALMFSEKNDKTIIGVLVRLRFFPFKNCKFEKIVKKIKIKKRSIKQLHYNGR